MVIKHPSSITELDRIVADWALTDLSLTGTTCSVAWIEGDEPTLTRQQRRKAARLAKKATRP